MRGRGLKRITMTGTPAAKGVALHAGAWIETLALKFGTMASSVALHAGAWIETVNAINVASLLGVALHAGAWIETYTSALNSAPNGSRPPCGGVD